MGRTESFWIGLAVSAGLVALMAVALLWPNVISGAGWRTITLTLMALAVLVIVIYAMLRCAPHGWRRPALYTTLAIPVLAVMGLVGAHAEALWFFATTSSLERNGVQFGRADDGRFRPLFEVNGSPVWFVVDPEFKHVLISPSDARRIGLDPSSLTFNVPIDGPDGPQSAAATATLSIEIWDDTSITDVPALVSAHELKTSILGRDFLDRADEWGIRGDVMIIAP